MINIFLVSEHEKINHFDVDRSVDNLKSDINYQKVIERSIIYTDCMVFMINAIRSLLIAG